MFAEGPAAKPGSKKPATASKKVEPPKPAAPTLAPPRLVKTAKPAAPSVPVAESAAPAESDVSQTPQPPPVEETPPPQVVEVESAVSQTPPEPAPVEMESGPSEQQAPPVVAVVEPGISPTPPPPAEAPVRPVAAAPRAPAPKPAPMPGRMVPPSIRLRIEEPNAPGTSSVPAMPTRPAAPRLRPSDKVVPPRPTAPLPPATGNLARPGGPGGISTRPAPQRPSYPPMRPNMTPGGPRPLPTPPVRPQQPPQGMRPSGGVGQQRPGAPRFTPPPMRPTAGRRPDGDQRREVRPSAPAPAAPPPITRTVTFVEGMTVKDLADKLDQRVKDVLKKLLDKRLMMTINSTVDTDTASMIAREFGAEVQLRTFEQDMLEVEAEEVKPEDTVTRAPVVTVMGHVDHGKTTLLDAIRTTRVAEREAGGITQHIGAYHVTAGNRSIVFLDTPGHEAFTLMRARGAKVTDVVVLVVAADDGVMPQTREAIDHAKAANVPIIVAINKIDKPGSDPERVRRELSDLNLVPEDWGGQTVMVPVSAKKKTGLDTLLEMILLVSDIGEYKANPKRNASGTVLESKLDRGRGPVATILVQDGTLRVGDTFIAGPIVGRVRALIDDRGKPIKQAGPSTPVEVLGLTGLPQPGDAFQALADAAKARQIATYRQGMAKEKALGAKGSRLTLESLQQQIAEGNMKDLPIVIKSDVQGSAEVLADTLSKLSDDRVRIKIIHSGVGAINESDVLLASASNAIIIGFNVRPDRNAQELAEREEVDIRHHTVIYNVTDEMKKAMTGLLEPTLKEVRLGAAEVRNIFKVPKAGTIAGCYVLDGRITRSGETKARLMRDGSLVHEGKISSLRRFKDDVGEVKAGFECGIAFEKYNDIKVGDVIEVFTVERVAVSA
jgi:translation initiation factor IF-2